MSFILQVLFRFFTAGLFAVGGGFAVIPFFNEMAVKYGWLSADTLSIIIAVSQSMPGPIGVNMAVYAGCVIFKSFWGGLAAALTLVFPSVVIVILVARVLQKFKENRYVKMAFYGIRPAVVALITSACMSMFLEALFHIELFEQTGSFLGLFNYFNLAIFAVMLVIHYKVKLKGKELSPVVFIIASACMGILFQL
ncbi:MAG: chromate transporter [Oscillospiraceae bacterium]|nr:chromate transporter [Oscillospiraceae bacterium]